MSAAWRMDVFQKSSSVLSAPLVQGVSAVQVCSGARRVGRPGLLWCKACRPSRSALVQGVSAVQVCSGARRVGRPGLLWCKACRPSRSALVQGVSAVQICSAIQGSMETRDKICPDQHLFRGICCSRMHQLATDCEEWCEEGRRKKKRTVDGEERLGEKPLTTTSLYQTVYSCTI